MIWGNFFFLKKPFFVGAKKKAFLVFFGIFLNFFPGGEKGGAKYFLNLVLLLLLWKTLRGGVYGSSKLFGGGGEGFLLGQFAHWGFKPP